MRSPKRAVLVARRTDSDAVAKPVPPADMWEKMAALLSKTKPPNSFTCKEFFDRFQVKPSNGRHLIARLISDGKVKRLGRSCYIFMGDDADAATKPK